MATKQLINAFIATTEYKDVNDITYTIKFVDDIKAYIQQDDYEYAKRINGNVYGAFYVSSNRERMLLVEMNDNDEAMLQTIYHEAVHLYDFYMYSISSGEDDYRKLLDDEYFILW
jgi:hypothetical protein